MNTDAPVLAPPAPGGTVLCVEDDPISLVRVEALLSDLPGVRLLKASTGREGIAVAIAQQPDVVLLDMHLPDIGGLEVVRSLSEPISEGLMRVILLTGDSFSIDVVKAMSLGAHDYWLKPVAPQRILEGVARALAGVAAARARPPR